MARVEPLSGFSPNWSTHPGEHLEEYLEVNGWSQAEFARRAGLTPKLVSEIVNAKNPVTPDTALRLERVLGLKAEIWMGLQSSWDIFQARRRERESGPAGSWLSRFPVRELKARKLLPDTRDEGALLEAMLTLFGIGSLTAYQSKIQGLAVQHRQSKCTESLPDHVYTWLLLGERRAKEIAMPDFDYDLFQVAVKKIRECTLEAPEVFAPRMTKFCQEAGVAVVFERPISKTHIFGSTFWINGNRNAIIQMSLRMKSNDHFWWTFFHECGHVSLHRGKNFLDDQNATGDGPEDEADNWAETLLFGSGGRTAIIAESPRSEARIRAISASIGLHPGIVVGMLQHYGVVPFRNLNKLKRRLDSLDAMVA